MRFFAVENKALGKVAAEFAQVGESDLTLPILPYLKRFALCHSNLNIIALFQVERLNHRRG
jgi:hypothetical protein